jgi:hypothetical protein
MRLHTRAGSRLKESSLSNGALLWGAVLLDGLLAFVHGLGFSLLEQGRRCEVIDECASGFAGHPSGLFY